MAADNDDKPLDILPPEQRLENVLAAKWDAGKMSSLMRRSEASKTQRLDMTQRSRFEGRLGVDLGDVRIFTGDLAEEITRAHNAEALTIGNTGMILMRQSSVFAPGSAAGTALLAHELTHVAQGKDSAISRKATTADLAHEDSSEAEAEAVEADVRAEEMGLKPVGGAASAAAAKKDDKKKEDKEKLVAAVLKLMEDDTQIWGWRLGMDPGY